MVVRNGDADVHVGRLIALLQYLWTYLVLRLGLRWRGIALVVGILVSVGLFVYGRVRGKAVGTGRLVSAGLFATYVVVVVAAMVIVSPRLPSRIAYFDVIGRLWRIFEGGRAFDPEPLANMLLLVPVGILLPSATGSGLRRTLLFSLLLNRDVEAAQYLWSRGQCEPADIVLNVFGVLVGYGVWSLAHVVSGRRRRQLRHMR